MIPAILPSGMLRMEEDAGPRCRLGIPTAPIGTLWPEWWPVQRPPAPPALPPVQPYEGEEDCQDATTRPRDREFGPQQYKGKRFTEEDVPPYQIAPLNPWARYRAVVE